MATVIGDCADCITSLPPAPPASLRFKINAIAGQNLVTKNVDTINATYPAQAVGTLSQSLAASGVITLGTVAGLSISTSAPVTVVLVKASVATTINVNKVLIVDDYYTSVTITNPSTTAPVNISVCYAQNETLQSIS